MDEDRRKSLVFQRGQLKAQLTKFTTYVASVSPQTDILHLKIREEKADKLIERFDFVQLQLEEFDSSAEMQAERNTFETSYYDVMAKSRKIIESREQSQAGTLLHSQTSSAEAHQSASHTSARQVNHPALSVQIKLPTISLPTYSGDYDEWVSFRDTFKSLINDNTTLSAVQKMHYLRASLQGEAANIIHTLEISDQNYEIAWKLITERYEKKRLIVQRHVKALFELTAVTQESAADLRQLIDTMQRHIRALKALEQPTEQWSTLLIHLLTSKLDKLTLREWELSISDKENPTMDELTKFVTNRCQVLEAMDKGDTRLKQTSHSSKVTSAAPRSSKVLAHTSGCYKCQQNHSIYSCPEFNKLSANERYQEAKRLKLYFNCLKATHRISECQGGGCRICQKKHNTLLHLDHKARQDKEYRPQDSANNVQNRADTTSRDTTAATSNAPTSIVATATRKATREILLATALIDILDYQGNKHTCRALLDSGSQSNFITNKMSAKLNLREHKAALYLKGVDNTTPVANKCTNTSISSRNGKYQAKLEFLVLDSILDRVPTINPSQTNWPIPESIQLADPGCINETSVDVLLGAEPFWELLGPRRIKLGPQLPMLQETKLGWVFVGTVNSTTQMQNRICCFVASTPKVDSQQLWELEDWSDSHGNRSAEEIMCEAHFCQNTSRHQQDNKFIVRLPFKEEPTALGRSDDIALRRFYQVERRLQRDEELRKEYVEFMRSYESLGHMEVVSIEELQTDKPKYFMPHHPVIRKDHITTKVRVVYDASAPSDNGKSLNDLLMVGPVIQTDLFILLTKFRLHKYAITADIEKMYRQIWLHEEDQNLQLIYWRENVSDPVQVYRLKTNTYGTAAAPFLAVRCLQEIAMIMEQQYPLAARVIKEDFYVDDLLTGADSIDEALEIERQTNEVLSTAGFYLRKWCTNEPVLVPTSSQENDQLHAVEIGKGQSTKALGISWLPHEDEFQYKVAPPSKAESVATKRSFLSETSRIFDPLGLIGPVIVIAKILLQQLWQEKLDWDDTLPEPIQRTWRNYKSQLVALNDLKIPRYVSSQARKEEIQIHGFADASEKAYGACLYLRTRDSNGEISVHLLCSKSRVAPLKRQTLPRLELCAASLLAKLYDKINNGLKIEHQAYFWSDSTIVLAWITGEPNNWQSFVSNRVKQVQETTTKENWRHVRTHENPADLLSRGVQPPEIGQKEIWWRGPRWLQETEEHWPTLALKIPARLPEKKREFVLANCTIPTLQIAERYSKLTKAQRVTAYCLRWKNNALNKSNKRKAELQTDELQTALQALIYICQRKAYLPEITLMDADLPLGNRSKLLPLNPFIDRAKLLRVGGRLKNADIPYNQRHPIILPASDHLTTLIIEHEHERLLHAGQQSVLASLRLRYWPLHGRGAVRRVLKGCTRCFKVNPPTMVAQMGQLPAARISPAKPFEQSGVDFAGPIIIKAGPRRSKITTKSYIAVFVCMSTKAIHLELVSDLTSEAFIATLRRFIARRGKLAHLYSDNGTNFVGAKNELQEIVKIYESTESQTYLTQQQIRWSFIPPRAPHFGGIWEAAVKVVKTHLKKICGEALLTFEELYTVLTEIEACLNSRPLTPISEDPSDLLPLTPGHFLTGAPLTALPDEELTLVPVNRLSRWQHVQQIVQKFWSRWSNEYLSYLQTRAKWHRDKPVELKLNDLVLIKEDNLPPLQWKMGRIIMLRPGMDNITRVATIKTSTGEVKRSVNKLCLLPIETKD